MSIENLIEKIDPNFKVSEAFGREDVLLRSCREEPFSIHGVFHDGKLFRRLPSELAESVSPSIATLSKHTAGGRVRFRTDSPFVALHLISPSLGRMPHFALTGSAGIDLYADGVYKKTIFPPMDKTSYSGIAELGERKMRDIEINFPLYSYVSDIEIGLLPDAVLEAPKPYRYATPAVFYGSSITQGGCASRPGTCYQGHICRHFGIDYINLGFSGNAKGEDVMIEYLASLPTSVFFLDYDHNAPTVEHLAATHEKLFLAFRKTHPDTPVIMMTRPKAHLTGEEERRRAVVEATYQNALAAGDKNVYFIDGAALTALCGNEGTVDNCHPTDYGFAAMADALIKLIEREQIL
jgi:hypothetical protein